MLIRTKYHKATEETGPAQVTASTCFDIIAIDYNPDLTLEEAHHCAAHELLVKHHIYSPTEDYYTDTDGTHYHHVTKETQA